MEAMHWTFDDLMALPVDYYAVLVERFQERIREADLRG